jgi:hypothetical protein
MSRADRWKSDAQANAEALANRGRTYADRNAASLRFSWDASKRGPRDLRHACELVRRAYRDEVPTKLHESGLAADGTPAMTAKAEAYIFGNPSWTDAGKSVECSCGKPVRDVRGIQLAIHDPGCPALGNHVEAFYLTPFRATMADMEKAREEATRRRAAIVQHVAFGMDPVEAATSEGCHPLDAKLVVFDALCAFLRRLTDVRVDVPGGTVAA